MESNILNGIKILESLIVGVNKKYLSTKLMDESIKEIYFAFNSYYHKNEIQYSEIEEILENYLMYIAEDCIHIKTNIGIINFAHFSETCNLPDYFQTPTLAESKTYPIISKIMSVWQRTMVNSLNEISLKINPINNEYQISNALNSLHSQLKNLLVTFSKDNEIGDAEKIISSTIIVNVILHVASLIKGSIAPHKEMKYLFNEISKYVTERQLIKLCSRFGIEESELTNNDNNNLNPSVLTKPVAHLGYVLGLMNRNGWFDRNTNFKQMSENICKVFLKSDGGRISPTQLAKYSTINKGTLEKLDGVSDLLMELYNKSIAEKNNTLKH